MSAARRRVAPTLVAGAIGALAVGTLVFAVFRNSTAASFLDENQANTWLGGLALGTLGTLVLHRQPHNRLGPVLAAGGICASAAAFAFEYAMAGGASTSRPLVGLAAWAASVLWLPGFLVLTTALPLLFPDGRVSSKRWTWPARVAALAGTLAFLGFATTQLALGDSGFSEVRNPLDLPFPDQTQADVAGVLFFVAMALGGAAAAGIGLRMRREDSPRRQQYAWFVTAVLLAALAPFLPGPMWLSFLVNVVSVVAMGIGLVRHGLFDIEIVLTSALGYALLSLTAVGIYVAAAVLVGNRAGFGVWPAIATALAALVLARGQSSVQRVVHRLLFGVRRDPLSAMNALGERLAASVDPDDVLPATVQMLTDTLDLPFAEIRLSGEDGPACAHGTPPARLLEVPLRHAGTDVGVLTVGYPGTTGSLGPADEALLRSFARQVSVAAHGVRTTRQLRRSRQQLVTAREAERRRIHLDLHDGLGPALAGISLGLETAGRTAERDGSKASALLIELRDSTARCVEDVRRIVADLRPPALEDSGLVGALERQASQLSSNSGGRLAVTVTATGLPKSLPPATEVAAYRIAAEAMTNTARHAHATWCTVTLSHDGVLRLRVEDDGTGTTSGVHGTGISSMRSRAEELGGSCKVEFRPGVGTEIVAVLPLRTGLGS